MQPEKINSHCAGHRCPHRLTCWRYLAINANEQGRVCDFQQTHIKQNGSCNEYWHTRDGQPVINPDRITAHTLEGWHHIRIGRHANKITAPVQSNKASNEK